MKFKTFALSVLLGALALPGAAQSIKNVSLAGTQATVTYTAGQTRVIDFYGDAIFRLFQDNSGGPVRDPKAEPEAKILVDNPRTATAVQSEATADAFVLKTKAVKLALNKQTGLMTVTDLATGRTVIEEVAPAEITDKAVSLTLRNHTGEYFYGGGVQNGRFSHRGEYIDIVNTNSWTDGGVASPTPYYWSTGGYGMMWHTFAPGRYDFGKTAPAQVQLSHQTNYLDLFFTVGQKPTDLLAQFYQLTGNPVLLPKFGFYEGHLNAYNRDYWKEDENGILFEDGKKYKESQTDNSGIKESLNGEKQNYQFSARAVVDRYEKADMPLGWVLPNDGYGAGYGQTGTLEGNIQNLKSFGDYARSKGVEIGLWTQSDLHPKEGIEALLQRDIIGEVRDAGVRVLKTDVAWVGAGYSFGLNGVADVGVIMPKYGQNARPFIISLDGWAGTQRYAGIWTGDQTGGEWEYIRFHIPTYIGSGLSGQPNISSDMDGIFGGKNIPVNVRDFQWKTFTPMQLNMDGWGSNPKYPQALGEPATSINRRYLKLKSALMPYTYSIAYEAVTGKPIIRAMFLDYPGTYTYGTATRYQFMYGPSILVAPIYKDTRMQENGDDERDGIYLPEGEWLDWNNATVYQGGRIINNYSTPLTNLPVFLKRGAIIPMTDEHNNPNQIKTGERSYLIVPGSASAFTEYDDDGKTDAYKGGAFATTRITQALDAKGQLVVTIEPTQGQFDGMVKVKDTYLYVYAQNAAKKIKATANGKKVKVSGIELLGDQANKRIKLCLPQTDLSQRLEITLTGISLNTSDPLLKSHGQLGAPTSTVGVSAPRSLTPQWQPVEGADYCEVLFDGQIYSNIVRNELLFEDLTPEMQYAFRVRGVNADGVGPWADITMATSKDPLEFAIRGMRGTTTCKNQGGQGVNHLFDFDESKTWHTAWSEKAVPFDLVVDMRSVNQLDRFDYVPRPDAGNGTITKATVSYSMDKVNWSEPQPVVWARDGKVKTYTFKGQPTARYIKLSVSEAAGNFGSGQQLYVHRVADSEWYVPGDANHDNRLDDNDLTFYRNYTGLRLGDKDFEGYVSKADINGNNLIDAYDIANVAVDMSMYYLPPKAPTEPKLAGTISLSTDKATYKAGETVLVTVRGTDLASVCALSFAMPYNPAEYEYLGFEAKAAATMSNFTYDRLHSNGQKALYPTLVNVEDAKPINGTDDLFVLKFKSVKGGKFTLKAQDGLLVDRDLMQLAF